MRFAYGVNAANGNDAELTVEYWESRHATVDFVFEVNDTPVPVALAYQPPVDDTRAALDAFLETYETPIGFLVTGDTVGNDTPIQQATDGIIQLPYWLYLLLC